MLWHPLVDRVVQCLGYGWGCCFVQQAIACAVKYFSDALWVPIKSKAVAQILPHKIWDNWCRIQWSLLKKAAAIALGNISDEVFKTMHYTAMVYLMWQWNSFKSICSNYCVSYILSNWEERWQETSSESERVGNAELASFEKAAAHLPSATCGEREQGQVRAEQNFGFSLYQSDRWQWNLKSL